MGLVGRAADQICDYLQHRDQNPEIAACLEHMWQRRQPDVREIDQQVAAGEWPDPLILSFSLPRDEPPEGRMSWGEAWLYPSADLLMYAWHDGPYATAKPEDIPPHLPVRRDGHLITCLEADGQRLLVQIPLTPVPWVDPRTIWKKELEPLARRESRPPRKTMQQWLSQFQQSEPNSGQGIWLIHASDETILDELLTALVIEADKAGFPVSEDERHVAWRWIQSVIRNKFRRWHMDSSDCEQLISDCMPAVYEGLVQRFDLPTCDWGLRAFIQQTALGVAKTALRTEQNQCGRLIEPESLIAPTTGEPQGTAYPLSWIAQETGVSERTVRRWMDRHGWISAPSGSRALSEAQLEAFQQYQKLKGARRLLQTRGVSPENAKKKVQRWKNKGLSVDEIAHRVHEARLSPRG